MKSIFTCGTRWRVTTLALFALTSTSTFAQTPQTFRVTQWNVTNYGSQVTGTNPDRTVAFQTAIYGTNSANGLKMAPDVFLGQEFISAAAVTAFKNLLNSAPGSPGDWQAAPWTAGNESVPDTNTAFFYRTSKFDFVRIVLVAQGSTSTTNQPRNTYRYDIKPKGFINDVPVLSCYSTHLKAQGGTNDALRRQVETGRIRANANTLTDPNSYFLIGGDFNITTSSALEYQNMIGSQTGTNGNVGRFYDPINTPGSWNNNFAYRFVHTQEPSSQMDDRHDQILVGSKLLDNVGFEYVYNGGTINNFTPLAYSTTTWNDPNHSYRCWGNDGTTYNAPIKVDGNTEVGPTIAQALISTVQGNGHLPVFLDLRLPLPYVHVAGNVVLQEWSKPGETVTFQFRPLDGLPTLTRTRTLSTDGFFSFTDIPVGNYTLSVKGRKWLRQNVVFNGSTQNVSGLNFLLLAGDINGDNAIDFGDLSQLLQVYNSLVGDTLYQEVSDVNGDGGIDFGDLSTMLQNYNALGDE